MASKKLKAGTTEDRISELPDIILHSIICSLPTATAAARTSALSRRWRSLWLSCPIVEFDENYDRYFWIFARATISRFTRDSLLRMKILKLSLIGRDKASLVLVEQLFDLASQRKVEEITLRIFYPPLRLVSISSLKILRLHGIRLMCGKLPLFFNSLQSLHMVNVKFQDKRILSSLIASSPRLETLELGSIKDLSKLELSSSNLRILGISSCNRLEEIEIEAPRLDTLRLTTCTQNIVLNKIRLTAPELHHLEIQGKFRRLKLRDVVALLSKLQSLKTLILGGTFSPEENTSLRLSLPNLEELTLINLCRLRVIDVDGGPQLMKFFLKYDRFVSDKLKICKINHAAACRWELHSGSRGPRQDRPMNFNPRGLKNETQQFYKWKKFKTRFPQFRTFRIEPRFLKVGILLLYMFIYHLIYTEIGLLHIEI
ncbi:F-box/FBD/LRR-repeat protein At3g52680 [Linum perenne]